jgi:hypothetical protein
MGAPSAHVAFAVFSFVRRGTVLRAGDCGSPQYFAYASISGLRFSRRSARS